MPPEPTAAKPSAQPAQDDVDKFLAEQKALETHRQELIKELLHQKEAAIKAFDDKLAKLGYDGAKAPKRSHHKLESDKKIGS